MNAIKKSLFEFSPGAYFYLRDRFQFCKKVLSGNIGELNASAQSITSFEDAFAFTAKYLPSYQIESEIKGLIALIAEHAPRNYVEIGTADAGTHFMVRKLCPSIERSVAIDTDIRNKLVLERITDTVESHYIRGFSNSDKTMARFRNLFSHNSVDVLFIDGDHSYEGVKSDFNSYAPFVRSGGLIVLHDIVEDWGKRYGKETNKYTGGVPQFFSEIKDAYDSKTFVEDPEQDGFGIGVLIQP